MAGCQSNFFKYPHFLKCVTEDLFLFFPLSPICGRELERGGDCIQVYSCIPSPSPLSLSHQRERGKNFFKFPPFLKGKTGGFIFLLFFFAKNLPLPLL